MILSVNWADAFIVLGVGLLIVFSVLVLLVVILNIFGFAAKQQAGKPLQNTVAVAAVPAVAGGFSGGEQAAIAAAIHLLYAEAHDDESYVITIDDHKSSWNSKIFSTSNLESAN